MKRIQGFGISTKTGLLVLKKHPSPQRNSNSVCNHQHTAHRDYSKKIQADCSKF